jgi:hypothetical protein
MLNDPWLLVAAKTKFLLASGSTRADPRGSFIGLAMRLPVYGGLDVDPTSLTRALSDERFAAELLALLVEWGAVADDG